MVFEHCTDRVTFSDIFGYNRSNTIARDCVTRESMIQEGIVLLDWS